MRHTAVLWGMLAWTCANAKSTCSTSETKRGENGSLTCYFERNLAEDRPTFLVKRYSLLEETAEPVNVLDCSWRTDEHLTCEVQDGYTYDEKVGNETTVGITGASNMHVGKYACMTVPVEPGSFSYCDFQLKESSPQASTTQFSNEPTEGGTGGTSRQKRTLWIISIIVWLAGQ